MTQHWKWLASSESSSLKLIFIYVLKTLFAEKCQWRVINTQVLTILVLDLMIHKKKVYNIYFHTHPEKLFKNKLTGKTISNEEYACAHRLWNLFGCEKCMPYPFQDEKSNRPVALHAVKKSGCPVIFWLQKSSCPVIFGMKISKRPVIYGVKKSHRPATWVPGPGFNKFCSLP